MPKKPRPPKNRQPQQQSSEMSIINQFTITSPVSHIDIPLPSGFELFQIDAVNLMSDGQTQLCYRLSSDGGANFYADSVWDYRSKMVYVVGDSQQIEPIRENIGYLAPKLAPAGVSNPNPEAGSLMRIMVDPGSSNRFPALYASGAHEPGVVEPNCGQAVSWLPVEAPTRMNVLRLGPYFDPQLNLVRGLVTLRGVIPTPV